MEKSGDEGDKLNKVLKDLLENTTLHGLPKISSSKQVVVRLLWLAVFIAAFVLFVLQLHGLIKEYNSNPKQTTIMLQSGTVKFPAITLCNMNVVKQSKVVLQDQLNELVNSRDMAALGVGDGVRVFPKYTDIYQYILEGFTIKDSYRFENFPLLSYWEMVDHLRNIYFKYNPQPVDDNLQPRLLSKNELLMLIGEPIPKSMTTIGPTTEATRPSTFVDLSDELSVDLSKQQTRSFPTFGQYFRDILTTDVYQRQPMRLWNARNTLFEAITRQQSREFRYEIGHQFEDFVISSQFAGIQENVTYRRHWTTEYGNCYTIDSPKYQTRQSGPGHGFDLLLNLEMDEYISNVQDSQGVRIVLHEQGTVPFPNKEGITLAPGYEHQIGLKMVESSRLGHPYGICTDGQQFWDKYKIKYTRTTCMDICKVELNLKECGCMPNDSSEILERFVDQPLCKFSMNSSVKECAERIDLKLRDQSICNCVEPCRTTSYLKTISGRPWPTDKYLTSVIIEDLCDYEGSILPSMIKLCHAHWRKTLDIAKYRNNFMKIQIYFEDTQYQIVAEEPTYGVVRFLSDIGGTAGLFIGASVLSIVEILHVVLEIILFLRNRQQLIRNPDKCEENGDQRYAGMVASRQDTIITITDVGFEN